MHQLYSNYTKHSQFPSNIFHKIFPPLNEQERKGISGTNTPAYLQSMHTWYKRISDKWQDVSILEWLMQGEFERERTSVIYRACNPCEGNAFLPKITAAERKSKKKKREEEENQQRANESYTICFNKSCPIRKANSAFFRIFIQTNIPDAGEKQLAISADQRVYS